MDAIDANAWVWSRRRSKRVVDLGIAESSELTEVDEDGSEGFPRRFCLDGPGRSEMRRLIGCDDSGGLGRPAFRVQLCSTYHSVTKLTSI
jgi:hypothetical protein